MITPSPTNNEPNLLGGHFGCGQKGDALFLLGQAYHGEKVHLLFAHTQNEMHFFSLDKRTTEEAGILLKA